MRCDLQYIVRFRHSHHTDHRADTTQPHSSEVDRYRKTKALTSYGLCDPRQTSTDSALGAPDGPDAVPNILPDRDV
jgi:hypothetical protein